MIPDTFTKPILGGVVQMVVTALGGTPPVGAIKLGEVKHASWATPGDRNLGVQLKLKWRNLVLLNAYYVAKGSGA